MVNVLIVDDSSLIRRVLTREIELDPELKVVGSAPDPYVAREMIMQLHPDVITLDLEMPRMDGLTFLEKLMRHYPVPTIIVSSLTPRGSELAIRALSLGAVAVIPKPSSHQATKSMIAELKAAIKVAATSRLSSGSKLVADNVQASQRPTPTAQKSGHNAPASDQIVAIGASTGGTVVIEYLLRQLPAQTPGVLITQHMPAGFTKSFASRLDSISQLSVKEAEEGDPVIPGTALVAPGDWHMTLRRSAGKYTVHLANDPKKNGHRPSVEVLFSSVAANAGKHAVGVILTGMGGDGAVGLLEMKRAGAKTIAQDEGSCVVFGMPQVAINMGAVDETMPPDRMPRRILDFVGRAQLATARP